MQGFKRPNYKRRRQKAKREALRHRPDSAVANVQLEPKPLPPPPSPPTVFGDPVLGAVLGALVRIRESKQR